MQSHALVFSFRKSGLRTTLTVTGCASLEDAIREIRYEAFRAGYRPPRPWEVSRWFEPPLPAAPAYPWDTIGPALATAFTTADRRAVTEGLPAA